MQFQSDLMNSSVIRPKILETTSLGAAYLAGLAIGYWSDVEETKKQWSVDKVFKPKMDESTRESLVKYWHKAVKRAQGWIEE